MTFRIRFGNLAGLGSLCLLVSAATMPGVASATAIPANTTCVTSDVMNLGDTHIKVVPFGCDAINGSPFSFTGVLDGNGVAHDVTINTFEEFATHNGVGIAGGVLMGQISGTYVSGTIDGTAFDGLGSVLGVSPHGSQLGITLGTLTSFNITQDDIAGGNLPAGMQFRIDPNQPSTGSVLVTQIPGGLYNVSDNFNVYFDLSLNGGANYTATDPGFGLESFVPSNTPGLVNLLVPEPPMGVMAGLFAGFGLGALAIRRRKAAAETASS